MGYKGVPGSLADFLGGAGGGGGVRTPPPNFIRAPPNMFCTPIIYLHPPTSLLLIPETIGIGLKQLKHKVF